jgi:RHS repeat-associated protein
VVASATGAILDDSDFYPFGKEVPIVSSTDNPYLFTGKERDTESGLDYFGARHFSSQFARFLQPDLPFAGQFASDAQSWNLYAYARNNPLMYTDPSGRSWRLAVYTWRAVKALATGADVTMAVKEVIDGGKTVFSTNANVGEKERLKASGGIMLEISGAGDVLKAGKWVKNALTKTDNVADAARKVPNPHGSVGAPDHQEGVAKAADELQDRAQDGQTVLSNKKIRVDGSARRPDAQLVGSDGKTVQVIEVERQPESARNLQREAEYDRLGVQHETRPIQKKKKK